MVGHVSTWCDRCRCGLSGLAMTGPDIRSVSDSGRPDHDTSRERAPGRRCAVFCAKRSIVYSLWRWVAKCRESGFGSTGWCRFGTAQYTSNAASGRLSAYGRCSLAIPGLPAIGPLRQAIGPNPCRSAAGTYSVWKGLTRVCGDEPHAGLFGHDALVACPRMRG